MKRFGSAIVTPVLLVLFVALALAADAPSPKAATMSITTQERGILLGYAARAQVVRQEAERELTAIDTEQREYLTGIAARLRLKPEDLQSKYQINLATLTVEPKPSPPPAPKGH